MGDLIDLMVCLLKAYRPTIRGKKWYWPLFVNLLNTTVVAAWKIHRQIGDKKITYIDFRRQVTLCLLKRQQHSEIESSVAAAKKHVYQQFVLSVYHWMYTSMK